MKRVVIFGASGIIGQHLRLCVPADAYPKWFRRQGDTLHNVVIFDDGNQGISTSMALHDFSPDVIINLAGESRPDEVESNPAKYEPVNVAMPCQLAAWCAVKQRHYVHVSTQAVFGEPKGWPTALAAQFTAPFHSTSTPAAPVNAYGRQKLMAERHVAAYGKDRWTIARPTFVLGVRPLAGVGRQNPVEQMLTASGHQRQVCDRHFSVSFAWDVAAKLWEIAMGEPLCRVVHIGLPYRTNRHVLASYLRPDAEIEAVSHDSFEGLAQRPFDTTYAVEEGNPAVTFAAIADGLEECRQRLEDRNNMTIAQRAREIAIFTGRTEADCLAVLSRGFGHLHQEVAADFRRANPQNDEELLEWYRDTESYIWELNAYHADQRFNYSGMMAGIGEALRTKGCKQVLCLGDGIGDLTVELATKYGMQAVYHDLTGSRTAHYAEKRLQSLGLSWLTTSGWDPERIIRPWDAIVSLDYLEHVPNVEAWIRAIYSALRPGGWFVAQNAFNCGSGPEGSIPCHLACNDHFEKDWDTLLACVGFLQQSSNWYYKSTE